MLSPCIVQHIRREIYLRGKNSQPKDEWTRRGVLARCEELW